MSVTVTEKSTKATIWEAYNEALKKVEELEALKMTPEKAMENQRESDVEEMAEYIAELEGKVEDFPRQLEEAIKLAKADGKADASKSFAFEKRFLEKDYENKISILETKMTILEGQLASTQKKLAETEDKLSEAYVQVQTIATESVKSSGGVKILSSDAQK